ncbi:MAG TPA: 2-phosphosulfolactate phosphatase [Bacteroidales bacterium]|jgi:2-phosphosulfolactate phosphatase|nr:2-phosphosulfolactate phosphatase [Bacteroidales bacterium]HQN98440.1 2-phosphosulfolactate phosphatase [Bacteroidales bacterium]HQQ03192.1 2-phosphosulfolactate phosphatase [Bacteroidales bacterium]
MTREEQKLELAFTPLLYRQDALPTAYVVVLIDILRATTSICTAFAHGVEAMIPVATLEEAKHYKGKGYIIAAEREGIKPDFADLGNSAFHFMKPELRGKTIVYSTTNGTQAFSVIGSNIDVVIGAFANLSVLTKWLIEDGRNIYLLCAGWKGRFNLEDTIFAGALTSSLIQSGKLYIQSDAVMASIDLWNLAKNNLTEYLLKAEHSERLKHLGLDDVIPYTLTFDTCPVVPLARNGLIRLASLPHHEHLYD